MKELVQLTSAIDEMLAVGTTDASSHDHRAAIQALAREASRLQAAIAFHTAAAQNADDQLDIAEFLTHECHYSGRDAARLVRASIRLRTTLPQTFAALCNGDINWAHALTMVRAEDELGVERVAAHEGTWIRNVANQSGPERLQRLVRALADEQGGRLPTTAVATPPPEQEPSPAAELDTEPEPEPEQASDLEAPPTNDFAEQPPNILSLIHSATLTELSAPPPWLDEEPHADPMWERAGEPLDEPTADTNDTHMPGGRAADEVTATVEPDNDKTNGARTQCIRPGCTNQPQWCRLRHRVHWAAAEATVSLIVPICEHHREGIDGNDVTVVAVPSREHVDQTGHPEIAA
jgi:hypothetical protein